MTEKLRRRWFCFYTSDWRQQTLSILLHKGFEETREYKRFERYIKTVQMHKAIVKIHH